jgi:uncharacterized protein YbgA (DUF1722 family)
MTLDNWLSQLYSLEGQAKQVLQLAAFKTALAGDSTLMAAAQQKYTSLQSMIAARSEQACAFSTKYRNYLQEALGA